MQKKFFAITMASIMSLNVFPVNIFKKTTHAASFVSNVSKIENPVPGGDNDNWSGNYIYFGHYPQSSASSRDPIRWRVLDNNNVAWKGSTPTDNGFAYNIGEAIDESDTTKGGRQNAPVGGNGMLLYSDKALDAKQYHPTHESGNELNELCWGGNGGGSGKGCTLWAWLNGYGNGSVWGGASVPDSPFLTNAFSGAEQNVIMLTKVYSEDLKSSMGLASSKRTSLTQDKIFVPSYNEMLNTSYGFTSTISSSNTRSFNFSNYSNNLKEDDDSWLRSSGVNTYYAVAASLTSSGYVRDYTNIIRQTLVVCPAFNLNPTSVIFASEAAESGAGGKSSAVSSVPARFLLPTGKGNDYKLTLKDTSRSFNASKIAQNGNQVTISYNGAKTGSNEYISCLILDNNDKSNIIYYGKLKQASSASGTATLDMPKELAYGEYTIEIFNEQYNGTCKTDFASDFSEFTAIVKYIPTVTAPTAKTLTYNKNAQELVTAGSTTGGTLQYKLDNGSWKTTIPTATNAGNYTVYYKVVGNDEYLDVAEKSVSITIAKATPSVTAPTAKQNLVYNSEQQALVNAGSTTGGTMQYKVGSGTYSTNIPTEINAGTHTVYYKVVGTSNYSDVAEKSFNVTIAKATPNVNAPTAKENLVYDTEQHELVNAGSTDAGTLQYKEGSGTYSTNIPTGTDAGNYDVYYKVEGNNNYNDVAEDKLNVTIAKADPIITAPTAKDLTYNGDPQKLVEAGSTTGGTLEYSLDNKSYSTKIPTGMIANTYTVYYRVVGDDNYNSISEESLKVTIIINKLIPDTPPAPQEKSKSRYSITLKPLEPNENGAIPQYKKDEDNWQESNVFKNLIPNKEYTFYTRYAATEDGNFAPSLPSEPTKIRTLKKSSQETEEKIEYNGSSNINSGDNNGNSNTSNVEISNGETKKVEYEGGTANVTVNKNGDVFEITVKDENGRELNIDGKINLALPCDDLKPGTILVQVNPDGSTEVITDYVIKDGKIYLTVDGSTEIKIIDNSKVVEISDGETKKVEYEGGTANVTVNKNGDVFEITVKDENGRELNIDGKINLTLPCDDLKPGAILVQVNPDGSTEVIRKSVAKNGKVYLQIDSSGKFKIIDNSKIFLDVSQNHWAYDAVTFVSAHELFTGTAPNIFEPETPMNRAMMIQVLHNLEDNPKQAFEKIFSDVNIDDWFAEAVTWGATHRGTIIGYDGGRFGPNDNINREQLATILYRYFGENEIVDTDLNFVDADQISAYSLKALRWAVANKIVQGKGNDILDPKGLATRAEVAQMFQNLMLNLFCM